jgi:adenosylmethionine-8-amino-7-oxononanoate aminotransferase
MGHLDVMSPPLIITREETDFLVETLRSAITDITDELVKEGVV